jgi:lysyl-tRNA synthetase class 2
MSGALNTFASVGSEFHREIVHSGRLAAFLFFVALLGTFGFIRTSTWMIRKQVSWWPGNVEVGGTHVHHLVWGICAMMIFGYIGVVHQPSSPWWEIVTVFFAIGMGLALDEFALWVELKDVYWEKEGRKSIDAMILAGCAAGILLVGFSSWVTLSDEIADEVFAGVGAFGLVGIGIALINAMKEKLWWALASLIFWPAGVAPAYRLAKPHSIWARRFYKDGRLKRSQERYPAGAGDVAADAGGSGSESGSSDADASASSS